MSTPVDPSLTGTQLLDSLERTGPRPALAWYGEASRIELSGHVLANWVIKSIGHLHDEIALEAGELVVVDMPPHWKRLALALAVWSLGGELTVLERGLERDDEAPLPTDPAPRVLITDRPASPLADDADEVLAVEAVSLAPRYSEDLPPLVHDWLSEVRGSSDRLGVALPEWSGPTARSAAGSDADAARTDAVPRLLVDGDGLDALPQVLAALLAGGGIVGPAAQVTARQAQEESVTGRC